VQAWMWTFLASNQVQAGAMEALDVLEARMKAADVAQAQRLARAFVAKAETPTTR